MTVKWSGTLPQSIDSGNDDWIEDYSAINSANTDNMRLRIMQMCGYNSALGSSNNGFASWGQHWEVHSGSDIETSFRFSSRMDTSADRDVVVNLNVAAAGPTQIGATTLTDQCSLLSNSGGAYRVVDIVAGFDNDAYFNVVGFAGSCSAIAVTGDVIAGSSSVGSVSVATIGFDPQFLWCFRGYNNTTDEYVANVNQTVGFIDARTTVTGRRGFFIGGAYTTLGPTGGFICSNSYYADNAGPNAAWRGHAVITNSRDGTIELAVWSSDVHAYRPSYVAISFHDDTHFHLGTVDVGSASGVRSVQTNSLLPDMIMGFLLTAATPDLQLTSGFFNAGGMSQGVWVRSIGEASMNTHLSPRGGEARGGMAAQEFAKVMQSNQSSAAYTVRSVNAGSGGFSYSTSIHQSGWGEGLFNYWAVGRAVNAPNHLMDANSASIFLADGSDYNDNLMLLAAPAPPAITSTTFRAGHWTGQWLNASWTESFSNVGTPWLSVRPWITVTDWETWDAGGLLGLQWYVGSASGVGNGNAIAYNMTGVNTFFPNQRVWATNSGDIYLIDADNSNNFKAGVSSLQDNAINFVELDALGGGYDYQSISMAGSMSAEANLGDVIVTSVGQTGIMSVSFFPDVIFIGIAYGTEVDVRSEVMDDGLGGSYGFWDARSGFGRFVNVSAPVSNIDGAGTDPLYTKVSSDPQFLGASIDVNMKYAIESVGENGFFMRISECNTIITGNGGTRPVYTPIKFNDPTIQFELVDFSFPQSSATQTISLSFAPKVAIAIGTNVKTLNFDYAPSSTADRRNESFFEGFWNETDGYASHQTWIEALQTVQDTDHINTRSTFGRLYAGSARTLIGEMSSVSVTNSTNFNYYVDVMTTTAENAKGFMLIIGVNENLGVSSSAPDFKVGSCYTAVLSNGGYEEGTISAGWELKIGDTVVSTVNGGTALVNAVEGTWYARGAATATRAVWWQDFIIPASFGVASGNIEVDYSYYTTDYATDADGGIGYVHVINSAGEVSAGWNSSFTNAFNETWNVVSAEYKVPVPPGSAKVRIGYAAYKSGGTELSYYVDAGTLVFCATSLFMIDASPVNKDFATLDTQSWNVTSGAIVIRSHDANDYIIGAGIPAVTYGSGTAAFIADQTVTIPNTGQLYTTFIDAGSAFFRYSYQNQSLNQLDTGLVSVEFLNSADTVVGTFQHVNSPFAGSDWGTVYAGSVAMPANTRKVKYTILGDRNEGSNLDAYITGINGQVAVGSPINTNVPSTGPGSAAAGGGALFRSQPITDNRDFPTPLTNVRAFPSD